MPSCGPCSEGRLDVAGARRLPKARTQMLMQVYLCSFFHQVKSLLVSCYPITCTASAVGLSPIRNQLLRQMCSALLNAEYICVALEVCMDNGQLALPFSA